MKLDYTSLLKKLDELIASSDVPVATRVKLIKFKNDFLAARTEEDKRTVLEGVGKLFTNSARAFSIFRMLRAIWNWLQDHF